MGFFKKYITAFAAVVATSPAFADFVTNNPGFEDGFDGWNGRGVTIFLDSPYAYAGKNVISLGCSESPDACNLTEGKGFFFGQSVVTSSSPVFELIFLTHRYGDAPAQISVFWNHQLISVIDNPPSNMPGYSTFVFSDLPSGGATTYFEIHAYAPQGIFFDNVSVAFASEPGTFALLASGLMAIGVSRNRSRRIPLNRLVES